MKKNILKEKSFLFAIRIINLYKYLKKEHQEYVISKQILRSGTAIGALVREAEFTESTKDFVHKFSISLKETNETLYWLDLLAATDFIDEKMHESLKIDGEELLKLLISTIKTSKQKIK